jgi:thiol:disulfide interchange protein DsbD
MRLFRSIFVMFAVLVAVVAARAGTSSADAPHLRVRLVAPEDEIYPGGNNLIGLYFKLEPGWHVYWKNAGDSGEPPRIKWVLPDGVTAGPMQFPAPKRLPLGPLMDFGYEEEVLYPIKLGVEPSAKSGKAVLDANVDWLVCREVCIPGKAELKLTLQLSTGKPTVLSGSGEDAALMKRLASTMPQPLPVNFKVAFQPTQDGLRLGIETGKRETTAQFFPSDQDTLANAASQKTTPNPKGVVVDLKKDANLTATPKQLNGVLELSGGRAYDVAVQPGTVAAPVEHDWGVLAKTVALAFLGGLLLNLMPCVFPVLFLKGLSLCQSGSEERRRLRVHGFVYAAGILVSFWILVGALLGLRAAGASLGWGFQFQ